MYMYMYMHINKLYTDHIKSIKEGTKMENIPINLGNMPQNGPAEEPVGEAVSETVSETVLKNDSKTAAEAVSEAAPAAEILAGEADDTPKEGAKTALITALMVLFALVLG